MGQKTHPTGFRIGINKSHSAIWFANYNAYNEILKEENLEPKEPWTSMENNGTW